MKVGGPDRDRTGDLLNAIQARSQLRYRPTFRGRTNPDCNTQSACHGPRPAGDARAAQTLDRRRTCADDGAARAASRARHAANRRSESAMPVQTRNAPPTQARPATASPARPPSSPVCAKRIQPRSFWPALDAAYGSHFAGRAGAAVERQRRPREAVPVRAVGDRGGRRTAGPRRQPQRDRAPRRHLRAARSNSASSGPHAVRATCRSSRPDARVRTAGASPRPHRRRGHPRRAPAAATGRRRRPRGRSRRPRTAGHRVDEIRCPRVGDHHPRGGQHDQHRRAPEADRVVPVEVARLAAQPAAEPRHRADVPPRPLPRPPEVEAADREHAGTPRCTRR